MKKNGFTLAEVLITLAIIGVVASLTLPSLMTNTAEQQAVTAFRKAVNTLSEVGQMSAAVDGFDYGGLNATQTPDATSATVDDNGVVKQTLWAMMANRAQVDRTMSGASKISSGGCASNTTQIFFMDGTVLCYTDAVTNTNSDNVIHGYIDTNGVKGPNSNFTCTAATCKPSERKVGDQFPITLKGSVVYPGYITFSNNKPTDGGTANENYAARWAMRK